MLKSSRHAGDIEILHAGPAYVVIDKPSGMLAVPGKGADKADCAAARVREAFPDATGPLIVHRLDMETSGLMVLGLTADAQRALSMQFERREVQKQYTALVGGLVDADAGVVDLPLRADLDRRPIQIVDHERGKPALTRWRVRSRETDRTRLELTPEAGRTHQLRVHMATGLGRPILGDSLYGVADGADRLMLHATGLSLIDPESGRRVSCESPAPF
jgi:tRNA pseudouridine32 synthase/23S rRNA pseudouridine746 synthase